MNKEYWTFIAYLHWIFSSIPKDGSDMHRFSNIKGVLAMLNNLPHSENDFQNF